MVLVAEVQGRWAEETVQFLRALARAHAQTAPLIFQKRRSAWFRRWSNVLACSDVTAFALSLLDKHPHTGTGAEVPQVHEVWRANRSA